MLIQYSVEDREDGVLKESFKYLRLYEYKTEDYSEFCVCLQVADNLLYRIALAASLNDIEQDWQICYHFVQLIDKPTSLLEELNVLVSNVQQDDNEDGKRGRRRSLSQPIGLSPARKESTCHSQSDEEMETDLLVSLVDAEKNRYKSASISNVETLTLAPSEPQLMVLQPEEYDKVRHLMDMLLSNEQPTLPENRSTRESEFSRKMQALSTSRGQPRIVRALKNHVKDHWGKLAFQRGDIFIAYPDYPSGDARWCLGQNSDGHFGLFFASGFVTPVDVSDIELEYEFVKLEKATSPILTRKKQPKIRLKGWLWKKGVWGVRKTWKKRWFVLDQKNMKLFYFVKKDDEFNDPNSYKGFIDIRQMTTVHESFHMRSRRQKGDWPFELHTPDREWMLRGATEKDMLIWINTLNEVALYNDHVRMIEQFQPPSSASFSNLSSISSTNNVLSSQEKVKVSASPSHLQHSSSSAALSPQPPPNPVYTNGMVVEESLQASQSYLSPSDVNGTATGGDQRSASPESPTSPTTSRPQPKLRSTKKPIDEADEFATFGAPFGEEIHNKNTILAELDRFLGFKEPPAVEYIFAEPYLNYARRTGRVYGSIQLTLNPYGHAVVRYTLPDTKEQIVMNIIGLAGEELVNLFPVEDFFFGTNFDIKTGNEQGGIYNRNFVSVRVQRVPPERILAMHQYFMDLSNRSHSNKAGYTVLFGPVMNLFGGAPKGNCAYWSAKGMNKVGLVKTVSMIPKAIWIDMFELLHLKNQQESISRNVHVVYYKRCLHAKRFYGANADWAGWGRTPSSRYDTLEEYADAIVEVPPGKKVAVIRPGPKRIAEEQKAQLRRAEGDLSVDIPIQLNHSIGIRVMYNEYFQKRINCRTFAESTESSSETDEFPNEVDEKLEEREISNSVDEVQSNQDLKEDECISTLQSEESETGAEQQREENQNDVEQAKEKKENDESETEEKSDLNNHIYLASVGVPSRVNSWMVTSNGLLWKTEMADTPHSVKWREIAPPNSRPSSRESSPKPQQEDEVDKEEKKKRDSVQINEYSCIATGEDGTCFVVHQNQLYLHELAEESTHPPDSDSVKENPGGDHSIHSSVFLSIWSKIDTRFMTAPIKQISYVKRNLPVWMIDIHGAVYSIQGGKWTRHVAAPVLEQISCGKDGEVWGVTPEKRVYRRVIITLPTSSSSISSDTIEDNLTTTSSATSTGNSGNTPFESDSVSPVGTGNTEETEEVDSWLAPTLTENALRNISVLVSEEERTSMNQSDEMTRESWVEVHGALLKFVSVVSSEEVWGIDPDGQAFVWSIDQNESVPDVNYNAKSIGGHVITELKRMRDEKTTNLMKWNALGNLMPLSKITVTSSRQIWGMSDMDPSFIYRLSSHRLVVTTIRSARKVWDDSGTRATPFHLGIWSPRPPPGFFPLGDIVERSHLENPSTEILVVREVGKGPSEMSILVPPARFTKVWTSGGMSATFGECAIWRPEPPSPDYVALGFVTTYKWDEPPSLDRVRCLHKDFVQQTGAYKIGKRGFLWSTNGSSARKRCSLWLIQPSLNGLLPNTFLFSPTFSEDPSTPGYVLRLSVSSS